MPERRKKRPKWEYGVMAKNGFVMTGEEPWTKDQAKAMCAFKDKLVRRRNGEWSRV